MPPVCWGLRGVAPAPDERRRMTAATGAIYGVRTARYPQRDKAPRHRSPPPPARGHGEDRRPARFDAAPKKEPIDLRAEAGRISKPLRRRVVLFFAQSRIMPNVVDMITYVIIRLRFPHERRPWRTGAGRSHGGGALLHHEIAQQPDAAHLNLDHIAGFQPERRFAVGADPAGGARDDDVARLEDGEG